jgi:hypothetical protein
MTPCFLVSHGDPLRSQTSSTNPWIPLGHSHEEVQQQLLNNSSNQRALAVEIFWERVFQDLDAQSEKRIETKESLNEYYNIFNDIFFFGALTDDLCKLKLVRTWWRKWDQNNAGDRDEGYTTDLRKLRISRRSRALTKIYIYQRPDENNKAEPLHKYLEILLHEMIHAFIHVFICCCPSCEARTTRFEGCGGHGVTWHVLAEDMEDFAARFLSLKLDLGRTQEKHELKGGNTKQRKNSHFVSSVDGKDEDDIGSDMTDGGIADELTDLSEYASSA